MLQLFKNITGSRFCWFLLFLSAIALEACGLYFQYQLNLNPCIECVYERAFFLAYIFIGFVGALAANFYLVRLVCSASFVASAVGGLIVSLRHLSAYTSTNPLSSSCRLKADFPSFLPLDEIAPWMFKPFALCSEKIDWEFLGQGMPFWIVLIFSVSLFIGAMMFLSCFVKNKAKNFNRLYR